MCRRAKKNIMLVDLGREDYREAYSLQKDLLEKRIRREVPDTLILAEHNPVITAGRAFREENLLAGESELEEAGISIFRIERGGGATYHGPGQIVGYPIMDLSEAGRDIHRYIRAVERVIIVALGDFGLEGGRVPGQTGVWTGGRKIASIGIAVRRWVTFHGFSLNVNPEMRHFSLINPCGLDYNVITSMRDLLGKTVPIDEVKSSLVASFEREFTAVLTKPGVSYAENS